MCTGLPESFKPSNLRSSRSTKRMVCSVTHFAGAGGYRAVCTLLLPMITACALLSFVAGAFGQSAPFGLSWGPVYKIPRPSRETREDNVALLMYRGDRLPTDLPDTEEIVPEI